ncbi:MAG: penicillin acylase family protein, partial [Pseudomonadales bacterium]|nr:penicillin acylase family protein [Pseudomonadales bacterium]
MRVLIVRIFLLLLLAAGAWLWSPLPANQKLRHALADAKTYDAEIIRDEWGVPHIFGVTDADTSYGLGYAQAEDDLETLQSVIAATRGVLARYQGMSAAPTDYLVQLMGIWPQVENNYGKLPAATRAIAEAYAVGVNLYAAEHPDQAWDGLYPVSGKDIIAGFMFKTPFFFGLDGVLIRLLEGRGDRTLALAPTAQQQALHITSEPRPE